MAVRNFWIRAHADGATRSVEAGPRAADGGMDITLYQRTAGEVVEVLTILCRWLDGTLTTTVVSEGADDRGARGETLARVKTTR